MRSTRIWLFGALLLSALAGSSLVGTSASLAQATPREERNYWRFHDGRWSQWYARDRRWYYTDGAHWFYHNGRAWEPYRFDRHFGREGFERGGYVPPGPNAQVVVPTHGVYTAPR